MSNVGKSRLDGRREGAKHCRAAVIYMPGCVNGTMIPGGEGGGGEQ